MRALLDNHPPAPTVSRVTERDHAAGLLTTPFVASWIGRARDADLHDADPARRASAWAHFAFTSMTAMTGNADRPYTALQMPGRFYDPRRRGPETPPHLEIPAGLFTRPDPEFPDRLSNLGNGLLFPWWVVPEVLAAKRALFGHGGASIAELTDLLAGRRAALADALRPLAAQAAERWSTIEALHASDPAALTAAATDTFTTDDVAAYLPPAADLQLRVEFDPKLRDSNRAWSARRVGVWTIRGEGADGAFSLGVLTPRLTRNSLFGDPLFHPDGEAAAALLVRGLLLKRLLHTHLGATTHAVVGPAAPGTTRQAGPRLRAVAARVGERAPEASTASAVHFLNTYPDPDDAWQVLEAWARARGGEQSPAAMLTVSRDGFTSAHRAALRAVRRAETPRREDINTLLPLVWDSSNRVVRVTFSRPEDTPVLD